MDAATLAAKNPRLRSIALEDAALKRYARPVRLGGVGSLVDAADQLVPAGLEANAYVASVPELESRAEAAAFAPLFGFVELQIGWNSGPNSRLNGLEWHKTPEVLVAVNDLALLFGRVEDLERRVEGLCYDASRVVLVYVPRGAALLLEPGTLHLAPCRLSEAGFKSLVVLPRGTNSPLSEAERRAARDALAQGEEEAAFLFMRNKWLIAHPERAALVEKGALPRIYGENPEVRF